AFSMLSDAGPWPLVALTIAITALMLWLWRKTPADRTFAQTGFALIVAGALGNLIDRAWHGYVIDMIRVHTDTWSFAVFNIADSYISVGAALIIIDEVLAMRNQRRSKHKDAGP
ncbi:MAG: signal peptidase II, partial [Pseudomonadota bacterium]